MDNRSIIEISNELHDSCIVSTMVPARSRSRLAKRFLLTAVATFVAAGAMAYSNGSGHQDEAPSSQTAGNGPSYGGYSQIETQQSSDGGSAGGGSQGAGGAYQFAFQDQPGGPRRNYGPGDGNDGSLSGGFVPNGENGLMSLAAFANARDGGRDNANNNSDQVPGGSHGDNGSPFEGMDSNSGSHTAGDGGSSGGDGGNGGSGGAGAGTPLGGGAPGGSGGSGGAGGGSPPGDPGGPVITPPPPPPNTPPLGDNPPTGGSPPSGGDPPCFVACGGGGGQPNGAPSNPPGGDPPGLPQTPPGGDPDPPAAVPEPAAWLLMILGFGAAGSTVRAQRRRMRLSA
ncbi:PEPxxWA-CTERM sorting domain-containing protein [Phenylobacterium sp.]|uniref:PEPxxWA-CTERM sorting domain-containing protein n=1 Tax=Phenylobacterium sp. TaxID=1871053 RepID=UPI0012227758|nr:PEPxxWA-CTERM sorting domain-containing protein [Phenylobacterium sp.]THD62092.1 MAG: PEP-CTERM sorting domain-containing protein [Phenylobacterium sp.]